MACARRSVSNDELIASDACDQAIDLLDEAVGALGRQNLLHPRQGGAGLVVPLQFQPVELERLACDLRSFSQVGFWWS